MVVLSGLVVPRVGFGRHALLEQRVALVVVAENEQALLVEVEVGGEAPADGFEACQQGVEPTFQVNGVASLAIVVTHLLGVMSRPFEQAREDRLGGCRGGGEEAIG